LFLVKKMWFLFLYFKYWYFRSLKRFWDCDFKFVNVLQLHQSMINDVNKRVLIWRFTLDLIKINYGQIGDQTGLFYTTNPVYYTNGNRYVSDAKWWQKLILPLARFAKKNIKMWIPGLDINACPIPVKTDFGQVDLVLRLSDGTSRKNQIPKRAGTTDKSISIGIIYWVCCIKEPCLISNLSIISFD
jgi:hypothetical protein